MRIDTKISIGDTVLLFGDPKWKTVFLRIIDVLEGRQQLGRPEERGDLCHEN